MKVIPFQPAHLEGLELQDSQNWLSGWLSPAQLAGLAAHPAFTGLIGNRAVICAGVIRLWQGRYMAWALLSRDAGRQMLAIHRAVLTFLNTFPAARVEATVDADFAAGHRWIKKLGFVLETPEPMRGYRPDGGACHLYARVQA